MFSVHACSIKAMKRSAIKECNFAFYAETNEKEIRFVMFCWRSRVAPARCTTNSLCWFLKKRKALKMETLKFVCIPCFAASKEVKTKEEIINNFLKFFSFSEKFVARLKQGKVYFHT